MKLYIEENSIRLQSLEEEERGLFKGIAKGLGCEVFPNKVNHLNAYGTEKQLYLLLFNLTVSGVRLELH